MPTPARRPKRSPRRLRKFYAMIVKVFTLARVAKLADARDLKHDSALLLGVAKFCKTLQKRLLQGTGYRRIQAHLGRYSLHFPLQCFSLLKKSEVSSRFRAPRLSARTLKRG